MFIFVVVFAELYTYDVLLIKRCYKIMSVINIFYDSVLKIFCSRDLLMFRQLCVISFEEICILNIHIHCNLIYDNLCIWYVLTWHKILSLKTKIEIKMSRLLGVILVAINLRFFIKESEIRCKVKFFLS